MEKEFCRRESILMPQQHHELYNPFSTAIIYGPRRRYPYFDVVEVLAWSEDPECYAGSRVATVMGSHAGQVKGDDPNRKGYPGPSGWEVGHGVDIPTL
jgi:hypothetical protein